MNAERIAVVVASSVGMVCTFLPWAETPFGNVDGTAGDGFITLLLCGVALVVGLIGDKNAPMASGQRTASALSGGAAGALALWKIIDFNSAMANNPLGSAFSIGMGLYLLVVAGAAIAILPAILRSTGPASQAGAPAPGLSAAADLVPLCESCGAPLAIWVPPYAVGGAVRRVCPPCSRTLGGRPVGAP